MLSFDAFKPLPKPRGANLIGEAQKPQKNVAMAKGSAVKCRLTHLHTLFLGELFPISTSSIPAPNSPRLRIAAGCYIASEQFLPLSIGKAF